MLDKFFLPLLLTCNFALADESQIRLIEAPGRLLVSTSCITCHSLDYISMNSKFLDRKGWEAEVGKMVKVMGAPISSDDAAAIVDYLAKTYGRDAAASKPAK